MTKFQQKSGKSDLVAPPKLRVLNIVRNIEAVSNGIDLSGSQALGDGSGRLVVYPNRFQNLCDFSLNLPVATMTHPDRRLVPEVAIVVALSLRCQETPDSHGDGTGYQLSNAAKYNKFRFS